MTSFLREPGNSVIFDGGVARAVHDAMRRADDPVEGDPISSDVFAPRPDVPEGIPLHGPMEYAVIVATNRNLRAQRAAIKAAPAVLGLAHLVETIPAQQ